MKIKKGDKVKVVGGKDKDREGMVEKVFPKRGKVLIPQVNIYKKHSRPSPGRQGGIVDITRPLPVANVALICPLCGKLTRVGYKEISGEKVRICKKCKRSLTK